MTCNPTGSVTPTSAHCRQVYNPVALLYRGASVGIIRIHTRRVTVLISYLHSQMLGSIKILWSSLGLLLQNCRYHEKIVSLWKEIFLWRQQHTKQRNDRCIQKPLTMAGLFFSNTCHDTCVVRCKSNNVAEWNVGFFKLSYNKVSSSCAVASTTFGRAKNSSIGLR